MSLLHWPLNAVALVALLALADLGDGVDRRVAGAEARMNDAMLIVGVFLTLLAMLAAAAGRNR